MKFRKLERWEHDRTKALYETVFSEDKGAFADYYYTWKTKDNTIYAAEDEKGIRAMVHLNPFEVSVYGKVQVLHYIVAVATEESYRHQGLMRNLLNLAMHEMAENGEPFTFLMPASEAIYLPFGFRFASWQRQGILRARSEQNPNCQNREEGQKEKCGTFRAEREAEEKMYQTECDVKDEAGAAWESGRIRTECRPVRSGEYQTLADMANETLAEQADIFIWRNHAYYERLVQEQRCQGGNVMVVLADEKIVGTFCTAREEPEDSDETDCCRGEVYAAGRCSGNDHAAGRCSGNDHVAGRCSGNNYMAERGSGNDYVEDCCGEKELSKTDLSDICENEDTSESTIQEENYAFELREIIAIKEFQDLVFAALQNFADENGDCKVYGCPDSLPLAREERVPLMMARRLFRREDSQEEYGSLLMTGQMFWNSGNSGAEKPEMDTSQPFSVTDAAPDESVEEKFAAIKAAELSGAVIFINEVV